MEPPKYFFSYSRHDSEFVLKLAADLKKAGANSWLDQKNIAPGARWDDSIEKALNEADCVLVILSTSSIKSQNVMDEVSYAISKGKKIVPIMVESCPIPFRLARFQYIDFTENYDTALQQLLNIQDDDQSPADTVKSEPATSVKTTPNEKNIKQEEDAAKPFLIANLNKIIGLLLIILAVIITLVNKCPTNVQYFIIYALIGIGIALVLAKSADRTVANLRIMNVAIALSGGVALPFILFFTNPIGAFKPDNCNVIITTTSVTVFVHGKKSRQDIVLRQGYVLMDVRNGERKKGVINENGQAFFQNLTIGDSVLLEIEFSEPYKSIKPDSVYKIPSDGKIYFPIVLQGIDKVQGTVTYLKTHSVSVPLQGVIIRIGNISTTSDSTGYYQLSIPESLQQKKYEVWFIKEGFVSESLPAFPQTGSLNKVMEKVR